MEIEKGCLFRGWSLCLLLAGTAVLLVPKAAMAQECQPVQLCGDVDGSGKVGTTDALKVLRTAVGTQQSLVCTCSAGDGSCEEDLQTCTSDLTTCGDDLAACEGTPPEEIYEPINVCGTDEPGDRFTLNGVNYVIVETDVRIDGTDRVYALRFPYAAYERPDYGTYYTIGHYRLFPTCDSPSGGCPITSAQLTVCGKAGSATKVSAGGGTHYEYAPYNQNPANYFSKYSPGGSGGWLSARITVEEGFSPLSLPGPPSVSALPEQVDLPTLEERGWSLVQEYTEPQPPVSYETLRQFLSHVSIREL